MTGRDLLLQRIAELDRQIDAKESAAIEAEVELTAGAKGVITRWKNKLKEFEEELAKLDEPKPVVPPITTPPPVTDTQGQSRLRDFLQQMSRDVLAQPVLNPALDVAVFVRRMGVVHHSHCTDHPNLEADFVRMVEQMLCPDYRHSYQANNMKKPIKTWTAMEAYLLATHKSNSTVFQELGQLDKLTLGRDEYLRDFSARVRAVGGDVSVVIKSKFKDMQKRDMNVDDLFEILMSDCMIKQMQAHPVYQTHFDSIVKDLDTTFKVEEVAGKASLYADRQVKPQIPIVSSAPQAYVAMSPTDDRITQLEKTLKSFAAKLDKQNDESSSSSNNQKRPWKPLRELIKDPDFVKNAKTKQCKIEEKHGNCDRTEFVCPFKHSKKSSSFFTQISSDMFH